MGQPETSFVHPPRSKVEQGKVALSSSNAWLSGLHSQSNGETLSSMNWRQAIPHRQAVPLPNVDIQRKSGRSTSSARSGSLPTRLVIDG